MKKPGLSLGFLYFGAFLFTVYTLDTIDIHFHHADDLLSTVDNPDI